MRKQYGDEHTESHSLLDSIDEITPKGKGRRLHTACGAKLEEYIAHEE